ncbi:MAG: glycoside hydrolase family 30 protein [Pseudobdellovibrionaceae bacterium]
MRSILLSVPVLFWLSHIHASTICKSKKDDVSFCGYPQEYQLQNYKNILGETAKSIPPEETLTLVDSKGISTRKYAESAIETSAQDRIVIKVDSNITYQTIYGFGASITESCLENLKRLSPAEKEKFFKDIFDRKKGAGFSYLRVPIGANDFSVGDYTLNDTPGNRPDPQLKLYNPQKLQSFIQFIQEAKKYNPDIKILMSPWTAPAWMKDTHSLKGGQIEKKYHEAYSRYLLKTIDEFESKGVTIQQMTFLNEPLLGWAKENWEFPQTYMSPQDQESFIKRNLSPKLKGKTTKLLIHDHNWDNVTAVENIIDKNKKNPTVQGIAYHCYGGNFSTIKKNIERHPDVPAFNTECTSSFDSGSDQDTFNWWQTTQSLDALKAGISGSLGWNLCLDEKGGPQNNGCDNCRGMVTIDSKTKEMSFNPEFKALALTSKVLDPGSIRIDSKESNPHATSVAFKNPDGSLSLLLKNKSPTSQAYSVNIDDCAPKQYSLPAGATLSVRWFPN